MRSWGKSAAIALTSLLAAALPACSSSDASSPQFDQWKLCTDAECTSLSVPLDWQKPEGEKIKLHVVRHRAQAGDQRIGVLIVNPGGPGLSGATMVHNAPAFLSPEIIRRFDVVSWDLRGTGKSSPQFRCDITHTLGLASTKEAFTLQSNAVNNCARGNSLLIKHMSTVDSANDLDAIRQALGESQLSFLGYSYGALLGTVWSAKFPHTVRALALDSPPNPQRNGTNERIALASRISALWKNFASKHLVSRDLINNQDVARAAVAALPDPSLWEVFGDAVVKMDTQSLRNLWSQYLYVDASATADKYLVGYQYAIQCSDEKPHQRPTTATQYLASRGALENVIENDFICGLWPTATGLPSLKTSTAPVLITAGTNDAVTPLDGATALKSHLPHSTMISVTNNRHTNYLLNECATRAINKFLIALTTPDTSLCR